MATILVEILGNAKQFKSELDGAVASTATANSSFAKMSKVAGVAGLAITGGLAVGLGKAVHSALAAQEETGKLNKAFENAGMSAKGMAPLVDQLEGSERKLGFTNNDVRGSLTKLITAGDSAKKATKDLAAASDLARFKNESLAAATSQLIKVHAGNTRALKEVGIVIPPVTRAVQALKDAGVSNTTALGRHELALAAVKDKLASGAAAAAILTAKVKGQAAEFSNSAAGGMAQFHAQLGQLAEKIGVALIPALTSASSALARGAAFLSQHSTLAKGLVIGLGALAGVLLTVSIATKLYAAGQAIVAGATAAWSAAQWLLNAALDANPIGIVVIAIAALVTGVILAYQHSATFRAIVTGAFDAVKTAAQGVLNFFKSSWTFVAGLITAPFAPIVALAKDAFGVGSAIEGAFTAAKNFVGQNWPEIATIISGPFAPIVALATNAFGVRSALTGAVGQIKTAVGKGISEVVGFFTDLPGKITAALGDVSKLLYNAGSSIITGLISGMTSELGHLKSFAGGIASSLTSWKGPIEYDRVLLVPQGQAIMQGLQKGMKSGLGDLHKFTSSIAPSISQNVAAAPVSAASGGGSGGNTYITITGMIGDDQVEQLRNILIRKGRNTTGGALGGFA